MIKKGKKKCLLNDPILEKILRTKYIRSLLLDNATNESFTDKKETVDRQKEQKS